MRLSSVAILAACFVVAAVGSLIAASFAVRTVEGTSELGVRQALDTSRMDWAEVQANGLQLFLTGTAPSEAERFRAISTAGTVIDAARVIDRMEVQAAEEIAPPRFSIEILRNGPSLSLIGLIPADTDRLRLLGNLQSIEGISDVSDLLESAEYAVPDRWTESVRFAVAALKLLPQSKISVEAGSVSVTAMSKSVEARRKLEARLKDAAPNGVRLHMSISAPRPVITPFTLRFVIDDAGARFDACSADTEETSTTILNAAAKAGLEGQSRCTIGLGVPSPDWAEAAASSIAALAEIGAGTVTFSDADISLVAAEGTPQDVFDRVVGELENALPEVFALHAVLPEPPVATEKGPPEFTATLSPEGQLQLRGRLNDELTRQATESYARARFGSAAVYNAARLDEELPRTWPVRVLAGLEALSKLSNGAAIVTPDSVSIFGNTGNEDARAEISRLLSSQLGEGQDFSIEVTYREALDPVASLPEPEECLNELKGIQEVHKINFEPGSATIDAESLGVMDDIAEVLKVCGDIRLEIGGHTDSQGREVMNQQLSQARAQAVLNELRMRRVLTSSYSAKGYGEERPIADNGTEEGREANRRIEFTLLTLDADEGESTLESLARSGEEEASEEEASGETAADEQN